MAWGRHDAVIAAAVPATTSRLRRADTGVVRKHARTRPATFAEALGWDAAEGGPAAQARPLPAPIRDGYWIGADGSRWRRRGTRASVKHAEQLLRDPDVRVLLFYGLNPEEIPPVDREALWARARPYLTGQAGRQPRDMTDFDIAEFKNDEQRSVLIIQQSC